MENPNPNPNRNVKPRPFLRRGTGLLRFYKDGTLPQSPTITTITPTTSNPKPRPKSQEVRGRNLQNEAETAKSQKSTAAAVSSGNEANTSSEKIPAFMNFGDILSQNSQDLRLHTQIQQEHPEVREIESEDSENEFEEVGDEYSEWESIASDSGEPENIAEDLEKSVPVPAPMSLESKNLAPVAIAAPVPEPANFNDSFLDEELRLFELMENFTSKLSFCSTASTVQRFVKNSALAPAASASAKNVNAGKVTNTITEDPEIEALAPVPPDSEEEEDPISPEVLRRVLEMVRKETAEGAESLYGSFEDLEENAARASAPESQRLREVQSKEFKPKSPIASAKGLASNMQKVRKLAAKSYTDDSEKLTKAPAPRIQRLRFQDDEFEDAEFDSKNQKLQNFNSELSENASETQRFRKLAGNLDSFDSKDFEDGFSIQHLRKIAAKFTELEDSDDSENSSITPAEIQELRNSLKKLQKEVIFRKSNERKLQSTIDTLNAKISELQNDIKIRTARWASSSRSSREIIEKLKRENEALKAENENIRKKSLEKEIREARLRSNKILQLQQKQGTKENSPPAAGPAPAGIEAASKISKNEVTSTSTQKAQNSKNEAGSQGQCQRQGSEDPKMKTGTAAADKISTSTSATALAAAPSVTSKRIFDEDGNCVKILYSNGDIKDNSLAAEGIVKYYFKSANLWQTTYADGKEILEFPTGEIQTNYPATGTTEILYPDQTLRKFHSNGTEETVYPDKTVVVSMGTKTGRNGNSNSSNGLESSSRSHGNKTIHLPNGQIEIQGKDYNCRIYPDGTEKIQYSNGSTLTRYSSGRQRFKDPNGALVYDHVVPKM